MDFYKSKNELYFSAVINTEFRAKPTGWIVGYQGGELGRRATLLQVCISKTTPGIEVCNDHGLCTIKIDREEFMKAYGKAKKIVRESEKILKNHIK